MRNVGRAPRQILGRLWRPETILWLLVAALLLLPVVMVATLSGTAANQMELQAREISSLATGIRTYYADNVIARLQAADGHAVFSENYRDVHGGIPIPATLSIELGALFDNAHSDGRISYEFLSDYPFAKRVSHPLDAFEREALKTFRSDPQRKTYTQLTGRGLGRSVYRLATPLLMRQACVTCHNSHPDSPKRDWKVGDVRGIQEVTVRGFHMDGLGRLGSLMGYVGVLGVISVAATAVFQRQSHQLQRASRQLLEASQRESGLTARLTDQLQELSIFASVVDNSIMGITIADMRKHDEPLIYVNQAFTELTGYGRELALGYNCRFLQGPDTDREELTKIRNALRSGSTYTGELINYRKDGTRFWNRLTLYPVGGIKGSPAYFVANQVDVTRLKQQAGVPLDQLRSLDADVAAAQQALEAANRFGEALSSHHRDGLDGSVETEALLKSEAQAHAELQSLLNRIGSALQEHLMHP